MVEDELDAVKARRATIIGHFERKRLSNSVGKKDSGKKVISN